jgi:hypothetical protein
MKRLHYSLLLPLLHLVLAILFIYHEQQRIWPDLKNTPPVDEPEINKPTETDFAMTFATNIVLQWPIILCLALNFP